MAVRYGNPFVPGRARIGTRRLRLVLTRRRLLIVLRHLLQTADLLVVHRGGGPVGPHLAVADLIRVDQRDVLGVLVVRVGEVLVVVPGVREVRQVADGPVLVYLVAGRLAGGGLGRDLVRGRGTRREGPAVDRGADYRRGRLRLDGRPASVGRRAR